MSAVRIGPYKPRLAELVKRPGGVTLSEASRAAGAQVEAARADSLGELQRLASRIEALRPGLATTETPAEATALYRLSSSIIGIAGAFGLDGPRGAAASLCKLLDVLAIQGRWDAEAVDVHLRGLRLLVSSADGAGERNGPDGARDVVLDGLAQVVRTMAGEPG